MLLGRVIIVVLLIVFLAWVAGGLMRGRPARGRRDRRR